MAAIVVCLSCPEAAEGVIAQDFTEIWHTMSGWVVAVAIGLGRTSYEWFNSTVTAIGVLYSLVVRLDWKLSGSRGLSLLLTFLPPHVLFHELRTQSTYVVRVICPVFRARARF